MSEKLYCFKLAGEREPVKIRADEIVEPMIYDGDYILKKNGKQVGKVKDQSRVQSWWIEDAPTTDSFI